MPIQFVIVEMKNKYIKYTVLPGDADVLFRSGQRSLTSHGTRDH